MKYGIKTILILLLVVLLLSGCAAENMTGSTSTASEEDAFMEFFNSLFSFDREMVVGKNIDYEEITDFHSVTSSSTNPPRYQSYRFYVENGEYKFYHETREGDVWPLTEDQITVSGSCDLSQQQWDEFCSLLEGGHVKKKEDSAEISDDGDNGPWFKLYWERDRSEFRDFTFRSYDAQASFEEFCITMKESSVQ